MILLTILVILVWLIEIFLLIIKLNKVFIMLILKLIGLNKAKMQILLPLGKNIINSNLVFKYLL